LPATVLWSSCEQLAPIGRITTRRMFGKTGVFCGGFMLGMLRDNTLYLRIDDDNRATLKEAASFPPLNYEKKGETIDLAFWRAPERLFDEPEELVTWARAALGGGGGLRRRKHGRRQGENQGLNDEGAMPSVAGP
jgi:DNA transformation protein and related proteins